MTQQAGTVKRARYGGTATLSPQYGGGYFGRFAPGKQV